MSVPSEAPWIESREGMSFFVNAVLAAPALMVLFPLVLGGALRLVGLLEGPSVVFDTIPRVAAYVAPAVGWLAVVPLVTTGLNLRIATRRWVRALLILFLVLHLGVMGYTVFRWTRGG